MNHALAVMGGLIAAGLALGGGAIGAATGAPTGLMLKSAPMAASGLHQV